MEKANIDRTIGIVGAGVGYFAIFAPSVPALRASEPSPALVADTHWGMLVASILTIGTGLLSARAAGSEAPLHAAMLVALAMTGILQHSLVGVSSAARRGG